MQKTRKDFTHNNHRVACNSQLIIVIIFLYEFPQLLTVRITILLNVLGMIIKCKTLDCACLFSLEEEVVVNS